MSTVSRKVTLKVKAMMAIDDLGANGVLPGLEVHERGVTPDPHDPLVIMRRAKDGSLVHVADFRVMGNGHTVLEERGPGINRAELETIADTLQARFRPIFEGRPGVEGGRGVWGPPASYTGTVTVGDFGAARTRAPIPGE